MAGHMTRQEALEVLFHAAAHWADELTEYIIPASEDFDDEESAEGQRQEADDIAEALALLREEVYPNGY